MNRSLLILGILLIPLATSLNILSVFVYPNYQHWTVHNALITELVKRGHNLTVITNYPTTETTTHYREIHIKPFYNPEIEIREKYQLRNNISDIRLQLDARKIIDIRLASGLSATRHCLSSKNVQAFVAQLLNSEKVAGVYDVLLVEDYYQEALLYLAELIGCPVIAVNPLSATHFSSHYFMGLGELNVYAYHDLLNVHETTDTSLTVYANNKYMLYMDQQETLIKEFFQLPVELKINFNNLYQRVLFVLSNAYYYFNPPSPIVSQKEHQVGGFYIRPPKELPRDIKDFLQDANYGAIFMTFPSQVYGIQMDLEVIEKLLSAFAAMKQKVLFEWDGPKIEEQPKNVLIRRHIPMGDILAHPYVQLMFCAGDIWHIQYSIQRMVPIVGIPITREQDILLTKSVVESNIGKKLQLNEVTVEKILNTTKEMFGNQMLSQQLHYVASFYRNRPLGAMEEAAYWIEFAGKHKTESRIYRGPVFQGTTAIPPYYTKLITLVGSLSVLAVLVLITGGFAVYKLYFKGSGKGDKKAV